MFRDTSIEIIEYRGRTKDSEGMWVNGAETVVKTISGSVQPYSSELLLKEYGYDEKCVKRVFCDADELHKKGTCLKIENELYTIKEMNPWSSYYELFVDKK